MKILSFDTSNNLASVAIMDNGALLAYSTTTENSQQAEKLFFLIEECLIKSNLKLSEIDLISVTNGPGSFTGVRIGLAAALGIKMSVKIPVISLSNFQVIAYKISQEEAPEKTEVILDARREQIYYQAFDSQLTPLTDPQLLLKNNEAPMMNPDAKMLAASSEFYYKNNLYSNLEPLYIREPDVLKI